MNVAAASGLFVSAGAMRRGPVLAAETLVDAALRVVGLAGDRDVVVVVLPLVGLLLALVLITAGCGPPN